MARLILSNEAGDGADLYSILHELIGWTVQVTWRDPAGTHTMDGTVLGVFDDTMTLAEWLDTDNDRATGPQFDVPLEAWAPGTDDETLTHVAVY